MYLIVFIHELGHVFFAYLFNYKIKKVNIYPFGGYTVFSDNINKPFIEELLVFVGGILFQMLLFLIFKSIVNNDTYTYQIFYTYNITILLFNLIPVIPLDGAKILNIIFNYIFPFKKAHLFTIYISYIVVFILMITCKSLNMGLMIILLLFLLIKERINHIYIYNTFLIERYLKDMLYKKVNIINSFDVSKTKKYFKNTFIKNNKYYDEKEILNNRYKTFDNF